MKIAMLEPIGVSRELVDELSRPLIEAGHEFVPCYAPITKEEKLARAKGSEVLIIANTALPGDIIRAAEPLRIISVGFAGVDHVDKASCAEKGVRLLNAAGYCTDAVAELTIAMTIDLLRSVKKADALVRAGGTKAGLPSFELSGKTFGVIGTGHIGTRVGSLARAFGCRVLGWNRSVKQSAIDAGIEMVSLETLLRESDIVSLHVPLTDATKCLINSERIAMMKDGAFLINTARGGIVDSAALAQALNTGKLAGAGIDVYEAEPPVAADHPLLTAKNVIATPHVGFFTRESMERRARIVFQNVAEYLKGNYINEARLF